MTPARVIDAWDETPGLRSVRIALEPEVAAQHRAPGQVVRAGVAGGESGLFALSSAPAGPQVNLLVRRSGTGQRLIDVASPGATVLVSPPHGPGFPVASARGRDVVLFAAGSGISAVRSLVQHFVAHRADAGRVRLYYGQRTPVDFAYAREHAGWSAEGIEVVLCCSQPAAAWSGPSGYAQVVAQRDRLGGIDGAAAVFVAGPKALFDGVHQLLEALAPGRASRPLINY